MQPLQLESLFSSLPCTNDHIEAAMQTIGALQTAERRFFIVEKSADMRYNKLLNFAGVTRDPGMSVFSKGEKQWRKL